MSFISVATSGAASDDVGSSRMRTRGLMNKALAISTICRPAERQLIDRSIGGFDQSELLADLFDRGRETAVVDQPTAAIVGAEADILGDREMRSETQLLLHDGDAAADGPRAASAPRSADHRCGSPRCRA